MESKDSALREFVRLAKLAFGGDPAFLRSLAIEILEVSDSLYQASLANDQPAPQEASLHQRRHAVPAGPCKPDRPIDKALQAARLADRMDAPHGIIMSLATEDFKIAAPVLRANPVLTQEDLTAIIVRHSRDHILTIAKRWDVGPQLADALVAYGNSDVLQAVLRNPDAQIPAKTLSGIGKHATQSLQLLHALLGRPDLPVDLITDLLDKVLGESRDLLLRQLIQVELVDPARRISIPKETRQSRRFIDAQQLAEKLARGRGIDETILAELASAKKQLELLMCCSKLFDIDQDTTLEVMADKTGLSLATFCRAKHLNVDTFSQIVVAQNNSAHRESADLLSILHFYRRLPIADAVTAIKLWRRRQNPEAREVETRLSA